MQRASTWLALAISRRWGIYGTKILLLAGPGNNGADALYAGAYLSRRGSSVYALDMEKIHEKAKKHAQSSGVRFIPLNEAKDVAKRCNIWVDGLLGIGAQGAMREPLASLVRMLLPLRQHASVVAVDIPSGIDCDTGAVPSQVLRADLTVTMGLPKPALYLEPSRRYVGEIEVARIGLAEEEMPDVLPNHREISSSWQKGNIDNLKEKLGKTQEMLPADTAAIKDAQSSSNTSSVCGAPSLYSLEEEDVRALWPQPGPDSHKYTRGVVGIQAGSSAYPGAAILAVEGALALGPGMVRYVGPDEVAQQVIARCPEVVIGPGKVDAWVIGPGLDGEELAAARKRYLQLAEQGFPVPVVLDAGAIPLAAQVAGPQVVLTPHEGEMENLLIALQQAGRDISAECVNEKDIKRHDIHKCPARYARIAAQASGAVVVSKGAVDVVCAPDGVMFAQTGPAWRATAGAGDVLAGLIGAALASGIPPVQAAACAAYLHGAAAWEGPMRASLLASRVSAHMTWASSRG